MFRDMRRKKQEMQQWEIDEIFAGNSSGVLAVLGDDDYPYAVPLTYVRAGDKIYFHSANAGHKIDAIESYDKVSFCVIDTDDVTPDEFTTHYRSVIAFGKARIVNDENGKREAIRLLSDRYCADFENESVQEIDKNIKNFCIIEMTIEHVTGKMATELMPIPTRD